MGDQQSDQQRGESGHEHSERSWRDAPNSKYRHPRNSWRNSNTSQQSSPRGSADASAAAGCSSTKSDVGATGLNRDSDETNQTNEKKRVRAKPRRPDLQVYVPRGRRMETSPQQSSKTLVPNSDASPSSSQTENLTQELSSSLNSVEMQDSNRESRERMQRHRPEVQLYVPRGRRMQQLMIMADNENNENLVKSQELEAAQISANQTVSDTAAESISNEANRDDIQSTVTDAEQYSAAQGSPQFSENAYHTCSDNQNHSDHLECNRLQSTPPTNTSEEPSKPKKKKSSDSHKVKKGLGKSSSKDGTKRQKIEKKSSSVASASSNKMAVDSIPKITDECEKDTLKEKGGDQIEMDTDIKQDEMRSMNKYVHGTSDQYKDLFDDNNLLAFTSELSYQEKDCMTSSDNSFASVTESMINSGDVLADRTSTMESSISTEPHEEVASISEISSLCVVDCSESLTSDLPAETNVCLSSDSGATDIKCNNTELVLNSSLPLNLINRSPTAQLRDDMDMNSNKMNTSCETKDRELQIVNNDLLEATESEELPSNLVNGSTDCADNMTLKTSDDDESWDKMFNDDGEALDHNFVDELTKAVGKVKVQKPKCKYLEFQPKDPDLDYEAYNHLIEIADFPQGFVTRDILTAFKDYMSKGFDIKWVDDTHAIGVFSSSIAAKDALQMKHPMMKFLPLSQATRQTKMKAKRCTEFLQPYKARPETTALTARRLVTGALGIAPKVSRELRDQERKRLKEAKEKKKIAVKQRSDAWEGNIGNCAMDEV